MNNEAFEKWEALQAGAREPLPQARRKAWQAAKKEKLPPEICKKGHPAACLVGTLGWPSTGQPEPQECGWCADKAQQRQKFVEEVKTLPSSVIEGENPHRSEEWNNGYDFANTQWLVELAALRERLEKE